MQCRAAMMGFALAIGACTASNPPLYRSEFIAMGTTVSVAVAAGEPERAANITEEVESLMQILARDWYAWAPQGELARVNAALARGESVAVSPRLMTLLEHARESFVASEGYFDPAVAPLVARWGFSGAERAQGLPLPSDSEITEWMARRPTLADLRLENGAVSSASKTLQLDLGAIAKGRVVDLAMELLRKRGVHQAMINAGGNLRAVRPASGQPWRIAVRDPQGSEPLAWLDLDADESASTSGDYEHEAVVAGRPVHHLLDPHSGRPVTHTHAVTVLAEDATLTDAASTAIMAAGPAHWRRIARRMKLRYVLRVDQTGDIEVSSALRSRLHFSASVMQHRKITIVDL